MNAKFCIAIVAGLLLFGFSACSSPTGAGKGSIGQKVVEQNKSGDQMVPAIKGIDVPMRYVPAGSFQRDADPAYISVITRGFWMGETEVTQELFEAVMGRNLAYHKSHPAPGEIQKLLPVEYISWYTAIAFCNKLSLLNGKQPVYTVNGISDWAGLTLDTIPGTPSSAIPQWDVKADFGKNGYRLPTDMEWRWAAMGADTAAPGQVNTMGYQKGYSGSAEAGDAQLYLNDYAWNFTNAAFTSQSSRGAQTHQTGKKRANELELFDMSGNVLEWCWDEYEEYPAGRLVDYRGAAHGSQSRIMNGGSIDSSGSLRPYEPYKMSGSRSGWGPAGCLWNLGFRIVCR